jgi:hypothetical protein
MFEFINGSNVFLSQASPLKAVLFGLLLSWGGTQILKKRGPPSLQRWLALMDDEDHRVAVRVIAFVLAWLPVYILWPADRVERALAAGVTAVCAPYAYSFFTAIAFNFFPWLEPRLSARPKDGNP